MSNQYKYYYFQGDQSSITSGPLKEKDLALLTVCDELINLAKETHNSRIVELAKMKRVRSDFSLLARAAMNGSNGIEQDTLRSIQKDLRSNLNMIIKSPMPVNRKVLSVILGIDYSGVAAIIKKVKK